MSYDSSVYYSPEKHGLVPVAEIELDGESYSFHIRCVWRHTETGVLYTAEDSGCSCPSPFEEYNSLESLSVLHGDLQWLWDEIANASGATSEERDSFVDTVKGAIKAQAASK